MWRFICLLGVSVAIASVCGQARASYLLWTDDNGFGPGGDIRRANLDGSGQTTLVTGLVGPTGIAVNPIDGMMYWANSNIDTDTADIRRANLDGTGQQTLVETTTLQGNRGLALDTAGGRVYYADFVDGLIRRANLDGSGQPTTLISGCPDR